MGFDPHLQNKLSKRNRLIWIGVAYIKIASNKERFLAVHPWPRLYEAIIMQPAWQNRPSMREP